MAKRKESMSARIEVRCSAELKEQICHVAALQGRTVSDLMIEAASEKAAQLIAENQIIKLALSESLAFADALDNPPSPNKYLSESGKIYKDLTGR